jgi:hypothetical protein
VQLTQVRHEPGQFSRIRLREDTAHVHPLFVRISLVTQMFVAFLIYLPSCLYELHSTRWRKLWVSSHFWNLESLHTPSPSSPPALSPKEDANIFSCHNRSMTVFFRLHFAYGIHLWALAYFIAIKV